MAEGRYAVAVLILIDAVFFLSLTIAYELVGPAVLGVIADTLIVAILLVVGSSFLLPVLKQWEDLSLILTDTEKILERSSKLARGASNEILGVWSFREYRYDDQLVPYFQKEMDLMNSGIKVMRLVNPQHVWEDDLLDHCKKFRAQLLTGSYRLALADVGDEYLVIDSQKIVLFSDTILGVSFSVGPLGGRSMKRAIDEKVKSFRQAFSPSGRPLKVTSETAFEQEVRAWIAKQPVPASGAAGTGGGGATQPLTGGGPGRAAPSTEPPQPPPHSD